MLESIEPVDWDLSVVKSAASDTSESGAKRRWLGRAGMAVLLLAVIAGCYMGSLSAPFFFDDEPAIVGNRTIRSLGWEAWHPPADGAGVTGRPLTNFTLALNYAAGGLEIRGYRMVNLALHFAVALCAWGVLGRLAKLERMPARWRERGAWIAGGVVLLWVAHPLASAAVLFVVQRNEQLAALFYLLLAYCFLRATDAGSRAWRGTWQCAGVLAMMAGVLSKEVMATAPLLVLIADRCFFAGSFREAWRRRGWFYAGLATALLVLGTLMIAAERRAGAVGFGLGMGPWEYLLTQAKAIVLYLRLSAWPQPLVADYGTPVIRSLTEVWWQALGLVVLLGLGIWILFRRRSGWGFLIVAFFVVLAPSSSFVPLTTQTMAEHRMYLPLLLVLIGGVAAMILVFPLRWGAAVLVGWVLFLGMLTVKRTEDYTDARTIWRDTVAKAPDNPRAHLNLGGACFDAGDMAAAEACYRRALTLRPGYPEACYGLGLVLMRTGRAGEAVTQFELALAQAPEFLPVRSDLAGALLAVGKPKDALQHLQGAIAIQPQSADLQINLGSVYSALGRGKEAEAAYREALRLSPTSRGAWRILGQWLVAQGRPAEAEPLLERVVQFAPVADPRDWVALSRARLQAGRVDAAAEAMRTAVGMDPQAAELRFNHALVLAAAKRLDEAAAEMEEALRLKPDFDAARIYLEKIRTDRLKAKP